MFHLNRLLTGQRFEEMEFLMGGARGLTPKIAAKRQGMMRLKSFLNGYFSLTRFIGSDL